MGLFRHIYPLLSVSEDAVGSQTGASYAIVPSDSDRTEDHQISFRAFIDAIQSGGGSSPTLKVSVQTSHDGTSWVDALTPLQMAADGTTHQFRTIDALGPYVRATTELGGSPLPTQVVTVVLAADGAFRLQRVPGSVDSGPSEEPSIG